MLISQAYSLLKDGYYVKRIVWHKEAKLFVNEHGTIMFHGGVKTKVFIPDLDDCTANDWVLIKTPQPELQETCMLAMELFEAFGVEDKHMINMRKLIKFTDKSSWFSFLKF